MCDRRTLVLTIAALAALSVAHAGDQPVEPLTAFITTATGGPVLGDSTQWPDNEGLAGIEAADAVCRNRAWVAGLPGWSTYRAWISDSDSDAYCRAHGFDGTKSDNCGQATLPTGAGPWVRVDGMPWAEKLDFSLGEDGLVYRPLLSEFGDEYQSGLPSWIVWTGTHTDGAYRADRACEDWTTTTGSVAVGQPGIASTGNWGFRWTGQCTSTSHALLCLQPGTGPPLPKEHAAGRLAFRTSVVGTGDLGSWPLLTGHPGSPTGLDAGDEICRTLAADAGLPDPDSFKAWLSTDAVDAIDRFFHDGPLRRVDGVKIADDLVDLTDNGPAAGITSDEYGSYYNQSVYTGTDNNGLYSSLTCGNWTDTGLTAHFGYASGAYTWWSKLGSNTRNCTNQIALYCLADSPDLLLSWGSFESGDLSGWSAVVD